MSSNNSLDCVTISFREVFHHIRSQWKFILVSGLIGVSVGGIFVLSAQPQYEVSALLRLPQIKGGLEGGAELVKLEEPNVLIHKIKTPLIYGPEEFSACGTLGAEDPGGALIGAIKLGSFKGSNSVMELRVAGPTFAQATSCFNAVFNLLKRDQLNSIYPIKQFVQNQLSHYRSELEEARRGMQAGIKLDTSQPVIYLAIRDDIIFFRKQISRFRGYLEMLDDVDLTLMTPVYGAVSPVYPKVRLILMVSLFIGLFLGVIFSYFWKGAKRIFE